MKEKRAVDRKPRIYFSLAEIATKLVTLQEQDTYAKRIIPPRFLTAL